MSVTPDARDRERRRQIIDIEPVILTARTASTQCGGAQFYWQTNLTVIADRWDTALR